MFRRWLPPVSLALFALMALGGLSSAAWAQGGPRPPAPRLLPESTLAYLRIEDASQLRRDLSESSVGRMIEDPKLKPLVGELYGGMAELFARVGDRLGVTLDDLLDLVQGELALAVVANDPPEPPATDRRGRPRDESPEAIRRRIEERAEASRRMESVGFVVMIEAGERMPVLRQLLDRLEDRLERQQFRRSVQTHRSTEVVQLTGAVTGSPQLQYFERDGFLVFTVAGGGAAELLQRWDSTTATPSLARNTNFSSVMSHSLGAEAAHPQITFYADIHGLVDRLVRRSPVGGFALPILESLGYEKLQGIGGSSFFGGERFESITHVHLVLGSPRDGLLSVVRPLTIGVQPPAWVPEDVLTYTAIGWDLKATYQGLDRITARFFSEDFLKARLDTPFQQATQLDLQKDLLDQLTGRFVRCQWHEPPARVNSSAQVVGLEVVDATAAGQTLETLLNRLTTPEPISFGGRTMYGLPGPRRGGSENVRQPDPAVAMIDNWVVISDSRQLLEHVILTEGGTLPSLRSVPEYELISGELGGELGGQEPFLFSFIQTEETWRVLYEMATSPTLRRSLREGSENNPVMRVLSEALERNELPAFAEIAKYLAPSGAYAADHPSGLHYALFTLRPESN